jgi:protein-tyrosine-phosphatase/DNA-binding transcriptional ArsR family regulator
MRAFAALADPVRLAVADRLAVSDLTPGELAEALGIASNLLAHHLRTLEAAGLVARTRSSCDRRQTYVRLRTTALEGLLPAPSPTPAVGILFVCTGNSARSQLAAGTWNARSPVPASSAGTRPAAEVHPEATRTARRRSLRLEGPPRSLGAVREPFDVVVTVCDEARRDLANTPGAPRSIHWSVPDPVTAADPAAFEDVADLLAERVEALVPALVPARSAGREEGDDP